ncbi:MAG: DUF192 domain-containing protein [Burkholderiales bacterium]|nr:DUF192 domain-containing protein [Burkholderiales bacterium]
MIKIKRSTLPLRFWACLVLGTLVTAASAQQPQQLPTVNLGAGMHNIVAQVARTEEQRATGLMYRRDMPSHEGMVFVFERPATQCFWMRNTLIPLSTAFVDDDGTIVNIEDMTPMTENSHCSRKPVRFVLEMNQGWFAKRGFKAGSRLRGPLFKTP